MIVRDDKHVKRVCHVNLYIFFFFQIVYNRKISQYGNTLHHPLFLSGIVNPRYALIEYFSCSELINWLHYIILGISFIMLTYIFSIICLAS